jgi:hypothetical protein
LWRCCGISPEQLNPALHAAAAALNEKHGSSKWDSAALPFRYAPRYSPRSALLHARLVEYRNPSTYFLRLSRLPPGLTIVLGDVSFGGSSTPSMVNAGQSILIAIMRMTCSVFMILPLAPFQPQPPKLNSRSQSIAIRVSRSYHPLQS